MNFANTETFYVAKPTLPFLRKNTRKARLLCVINSMLLIKDLDFFSGMLQRQLLSWNMKNM